MYSLKLILSLYITVTLCGQVFSVPLRNISEHPVILVVSFDGFRYDYLDKVDTPALHELKNGGVSVPYMEPVFPTKTFPNHQSIATGLYAESHGIVDNSMYDPLYNKTLSGFVDDPGFWNYHQDVLPIWIRNEMAGEGRTSGCLMWPGSSQPYGPNDDTLPTYYPPQYDGTVPWENRVETVISWITNDTKPANLVFLYFDEPDTHGHAFGPNQNETLEEVSKVDGRAAYLISKLKEAELFDKINLIILSDHGMQEVTQERIVNITDLIDETLLEARYGGTPVMQLIPKEGKGDELFGSLSNHSQNHGFTIWTKEEMRYRFRYGISRRVLDYVLISDLGYAFDDFYRTIDIHNDNWGLEHVVPLISTILKLPSVPSNGSLERVVDMLEPAFVPSTTTIPEPSTTTPEPPTTTTPEPPTTTTPEATTTPSASSQGKVIGSLFYSLISLTVLFQHF
ncbi:unnamed protein product [Orchesella dallaii]|uniref:Ectonucleotide pyrophosphatase/phosphodiesterase family member 5 n=1 Tax=Orchesella dallaii TaxID=48710 RepID=A0ABP1PQB0_9HEXA